MARWDCIQNPAFVFFLKKNGKKFKKWFLNSWFQIPPLPLLMCWSGLTLKRLVVVKKNIGGHVCLAGYI